MKFGVREICDVSFKALDDVRVGKTTFKKGQPVLLIDTATTSTVEGAATTVYAQGGKGNTRLLAWEGEKTLTFTVEDALLSPIGFAVLSGAGLFGGGADYKTEGDASTAQVNVHRTTRAILKAGETTVSIADALATIDEVKEKVSTTAPLFVVKTEEDGSIIPSQVFSDLTITEEGVISTFTAQEDDVTLLVDYYVIKNASKVTELAIDAANFAGYYYVEASTLFRKESTGKDLPAEITIPKVKIQSNFIFSMSSTGDPSTFTFTMDAFPGYTYFNPNDKVLMVMQVVDEAVAGAEYEGPYMPYEAATEDEDEETTP